MLPEPSVLPSIPLGGQWVRRCRIYVSDEKTAGGSFTKSQGVPFIPSTLFPLVPSKGVLQVAGPDWLSLSTSPISGRLHFGPHGEVSFLCGYAAPLAVYLHSRGSEHHLGSSAFCSSYISTVYVYSEPCSNPEPYFNNLTHNGIC
jgi:hypothetical protein